MTDRIKVIIDTDVGDDIDDAFALLLAMRLNFEIIGITTVFQNTVQRARIAKKLLLDYGGYENVPVFAGVKTPIAEEPREYPTLCQYTPEVDGELYTPSSVSEEDAIDFIINSCKKYGKELTVIALGPFTNIAKVIEKDRTALTLVRDVVIMGGAYYKQYADWNVMCDPEAAKITFDTLSGIHALGADVTHRLTLRPEDDGRICEYSGENAAARYVAELYRLWKRGRNKLGVLHDPLVIYYAKNNAVCKTERCPVAVITEGVARGFTLNVTAYTKAYMNSAYRDFDLTHTQILAKEVDRELMLCEFMRCFE